MSALHNDEVKPRCVATTGSLLDGAGNDDDVRLRNSRQNTAHEAKFFREAQFSGDGTTIVTHSNDHHLRTFVLPPELLDGSEQPHGLQAFSTYASPSVNHSYAIYPHYDLQDPATTLVLSASAHVPISLRNALHYDTVAASYHSINNMTEAYYPSTALAFFRDGCHFVAGSHNRLDVFDIRRDGSGPAFYHKTTAGKKARKLYHALDPSCKGLIGALSISGDGILAAGSMARQIALFANEGSGECTTAFSLEHSPDRKDPINGTGITHLKWSPCGTYLLVAERQSEGMQVYDVRNTMQRISLLAGRKADTTQRLGIDVVPTTDGYEVWGGGLDGCVRTWKNPGQQAGNQAPDLQMKMHDDAVPSAIWHPTGAVLATCSGQRSVDDGGAGARNSDSESSGSEDLVRGVMELTDDSEREHEDPIVGDKNAVHKDDALKPRLIRKADTALKLWSL